MSIGSEAVAGSVAGAEGFELAFEEARNEAGFPGLECCGALLLLKLGVLVLEDMVLVSFPVLLLVSRFCQNNAEMMR